MANITDDEIEEVVRDFVKAPGFLEEFLGFYRQLNEYGDHSPDDYRKAALAWLDERIVERLAMEELLKGQAAE
jgi:hypothetical protein